MNSFFLIVVGTSLLIIVLFSLIGFPHADDTAHLAARRPHDDHQALIQMTNREETWLAIASAQILGGELLTHKHLAGSGKVEAALGQSLVPFIAVELNSHLIIVH